MRATRAAAAAASGGVSSWVVPSTPALVSYAKYFRNGRTVASASTTRVAFWKMICLVGVAV